MTYRLDNLEIIPGIRKRKRRKGRGPASGKGRTSGRGRGGSGHRSGNSGKIAFEGGQMPLVRIVPKKGFNNKRFAGKKADIVNLESLQKAFKSGEKVDPEKLKEKGLIGGTAPVKILGKGELRKKLKISGCLLSESARNKIEEAGGEIA